MGSFTKKRHVKPAPVTVKRLDTGEFIRTIQPTSRRQRREIIRLRANLGIRARKIPRMSDDADRLLRWLRQRGA